MAEAQFRFYEELNDFLPPERRKQDIIYHIRDRETVKHAIEACGVPHAEVELILVNGESVGFSCYVRDGDRISVYPRFEAFDISPQLKVRKEPLRNLRFIADVHLGGLAKYLRMLGFDVLYSETYTDEQIAGISARERRIVLTHDRDLLMHRIITHGRFIRATRIRNQLIEVVETLDLYRNFSPFSRCMECNTKLVPVSKDDIKTRLPPDTQNYFTQFALCMLCDRIYWQGSHYRRMRRFITEIFGDRSLNAAAV